MVGLRLRDRVVVFVGIVVCVVIDAFKRLVTKPKPDVPHIVPDGNWRWGPPIDEPAYMARLRAAEAAMPLSGDYKKGVLGEWKDAPMADTTPLTGPERIEPVPRGYWYPTGDADALGSAVINGERVPMYDRGFETGPLFVRSARTVPTPAYLWPTAPQPSTATDGIIRADHYERDLRAYLAANKDEGE